jgi:hypothetical protein
MRMTTEVTRSVTTYEEEFPKHLGPPPVPNYYGDKVVKVRQPVYTIELDAGALRAVWELLESESKRRFPTRSTYLWVEALLRGTAAVRAAYWSLNEPPPRRRLVRTNGRAKNPRK